MDKEIWLDISGFENYKISNFGRVMSLKRKEIRFLRPKVDKDGYQLVCLQKNSKSFYRSIHRLMAIAFIDNPLDKKEVDHKNRKTSDNRLENLKWCTRSENLKNRSEHGGWGKSVKVTQLSSGDVMYFNSMTIAAETLEVDITSMSKVVKGRQHQTRGFKFEYME